MSEPGPNFSQASSRRQSHHGSHPHVPSRKAQRRRGCRSSTPPAAKLAKASINSIGPPAEGAPMASSEKVGRVDAARPQERPQLAEPRGLDLADALAGQTET